MYCIFNQLIWLPVLTQICKKQESIYEWHIFMFDCSLPLQVCCDLVSPKNKKKKPSRTGNRCIYFWIWWVPQNNKLKLLKRGAPLDCNRLGCKSLNLFLCTELSHCTRYYNVLMLELSSFHRLCRNRHI